MTITEFRQSGELTSRLRELLTDPVLATALALVKSNSNANAAARFNTLNGPSLDYLFGVDVGKLKAIDELIELSTILETPETIEANYEN